MACESCPRAFDAMLEFNLDGMFESDHLTEIFDIRCWRQDFDVHPLHCHRRGGDEVVYHGRCVFK